MMIVLFFSLFSCVRGTALDEYVAKADPAYTFEKINAFRPALFAVTIHNLLMTSQTWLSPQDSSIHTWTHWLQICIPDRARGSRWSFLYIDGGHNVNATRPPTDADGTTPYVVPFICQETGIVTANLNQVPNEPATFPGEWPVPKRRSEDGIIAYTWHKYFNDTAANADWLLRLPMTKAAVRAMDTVQAFVKEQGMIVDQFGVAGASKRGWTTWTTAAVDKRVKAAIPIVMPILNMVPNLQHHFRVLGGYSFALGNYADTGCLGFLDRPEWVEMGKIIDPISYNQRLTMPKMVIAATGDEFFPPDSTHFFWNDLQGPKLLNLVPNAEHSLATGIIDVATSVAAFIFLQVTKQPVPAYSWIYDKSNGTAVTGHPARIVVTVDKATAPFVVGAQVWRANTLSKTRRDFRLITCKDLSKAGCLQPVGWWPTNLDKQRAANGDMHLSATAEPPAFGGWQGFLIEIQVEYPDPFNGRNQTLTLTSEINITPDTLPFAPCSFCGCGNDCPPIPPPVA